MLRREEPIPALSAGLSHVVMTGLLLFVALPALERKAQVGQTPSPSRAPHQVAKPLGPAPQSSSSSVGASLPGEAVSDIKEAWPQDVVVSGREQCMHLISGLAAEIEWLEPIKKGPCGLPAPVRLKSVGSSPKVVFDPPVTTNCRMVAALDRWVKGTLQPNALKSMKSEVVRIVGASGYSCRNIYNLPNAKLSQHALANAIDIGAFGFANGRTVRILKGWGLTQRDIKAQHAKAKAEAEAKAKLADGKASAAKDRKATTVAVAESASSGKADKSGKTVNPVSRASFSPPSLSAEKSSAIDEKEPRAPAKPTKEALFLRAIHGGACQEFGTVLGPEANDPHRNHFHLDLIPRRGRGYCQ